jgi:hypothetical protein
MMIHEQLALGNVFTGKRNLCIELISLQQLEFARLYPEFHLLVLEFSPIQTKFCHILLY